MPRVAVIAFGILRERYGHPQVHGCIDRLDDVFAAADVSGALISRSRYGDGDGFGPWSVPRFVRPEVAGREAQTRSLWRDLESVVAFVDGLPHVEALRQRRAWFLRPAWPSYAVWWATDEDRPTWDEAVQRIEHRDDHRASAVAFDVRTPFDADGCPSPPLRRHSRPGNDCLTGWERW